MCLDGGLRNHATSPRTQIAPGWACCRSAKCVRFPRRSPGNTLTLAASPLRSLNLPVPPPWRSDLDRLMKTQPYENTVRPPLPSRCNPGNRKLMAGMGLRRLPWQSRFSSFFLSGFWGRMRFQGCASDSTPQTDIGTFCTTFIAASVIHPAAELTPCFHNSRQRDAFTEPQFFAPHYRCNRLL